jgi:eukaryotic-like serine/threonine-protein kinase
MAERMSHQLQAPLHFPGGDYEVESVLGIGGMAVVYRALDVRRSRTVAIKVLRPEVALAIGTERFLREIAVTSSFTHPNILPLLDAGEAVDDQGRASPYYVMPLVEGESLHERLSREQRLSLPDATRITCEILEALQYAHSHGVIHRDIKPANILMSGGHAVVTDFGVSRPLPGAGALRKHADPLTLSGFAVGTPTYMSPEQALGDKQVDIRSDLYSVGCLLYEMVAGVAPFDAPTAQAVISRKLNGLFVPANAMRPQSPPELDHVLRRALQPEPSDRFASATEFMQALTAMNEASRPARDAAPSAGPVSLRRAWIAAATLVSLATVAALMMRDTPPPEPLPIASDKTRVAVLPLELLAPDSALAFIASALTTDLIDELAQFPALTLISRNGVQPFAGGAVSTDSIARVLNVGSVITGDVRPQGDSVTVSVRLVDGRTNAQLAMASSTAGMRDVLLVRSSIIDSVASFLRVVIGKELGPPGRQTVSNPEAWELLAQARAWRETELASSTSISPAQRHEKFAVAESLVMRAAQLDPRWSEPLVVSGMLMLLRATIEENVSFGRATGPTAVFTDPVSLRQAAITRAEQALARSEEDSRARYLRGKARFDLWRTSRPVAPDSLRRSAEADLRAVVRRRRDMAEAWSDLSLLLHMSGNFAGALGAADTALRADAYLQNATNVVGRLLIASLATGRTAEATEWCARGRRQYPRSPQFWGCELTILGWTGLTGGDVARAWQLLAESEARDSANALASGWGTRRLLVAAVAARAGLADSARNIVSRVRAAVPAGGGAGIQASYGEAHVHALLGDPAQAIPLLEQYLQANPALRGQVRNHPWFQSLRDQPRFMAITAPE